MTLEALPRQGRPARRRGVLYTLAALMLAALILATLIPAQPALAASGTLLRNDTGLYPRLVRLQYSGAANGRILASVVSFAASGGIGVIYESVDGGRTFAQVGTVADPQAATGLCCGTLYELPQAVGANPAGTLLWAAAVGQDAANRRMALRIWRSTNQGRAWSYLSSCIVAPNTGGLWEPEFSIASDGALVCHYADETDSLHSQKLMHARSYDGITWRDHSPTVSIGTFADRPGMPGVRKLTTGTYLMTYEICGRPGQYDCAVYTRTSPDGWSWGTVTSSGTRAQLADGRYLVATPTITLAADNTIFLIGQRLLNSNGSGATGNGRTILVNRQGGAGSWSEIAAPVAVPGATANYCPNYSPTLVATPDATTILEVSTDYEGTICKPYYASGPTGLVTQPPPTTTLAFTIVNRNSGKCVDVSGSGTADGVNIQQWTCNGTTAQQWQLLPTSDGYYRLVAVHSGKVADVVGCGTADGVDIIQWSWLNNTCQQFRFVPVSGGWLRIENRSSGKVMDVVGCGTADGTDIRQWSWLNNTCQQFRLQPVGDVRVVSQSSGKALGVAGGSTADGAGVVQSGYAGATSQQWRFSHIVDGWYQLIARHSGKCMDVTGGAAATQDGALIQQYACTSGATNQQWRAEPLGDGTFRLVARHSGKVLDLPGCAAADGTRLQQWGWLNNTCQRFRLERS